jgi:uncharacterized small protein (DUF1192 family)
MSTPETQPERSSGSFATDTVGFVYDRICKLDAEIEYASAQIEKYGRDKANAKAHYERLKNTRLLVMYDEERDTPGLKRTEKYRQVLYRNAFSEERFNAQLAEMMYDAAKAYLEGLKSSLTAAQTRMKTLQSDRDRDGIHGA